jgi:hypothetical protein
VKASPSRDEDSIPTPGVRVASIKEVLGALVNRKKVGPAFRSPGPGGPLAGKPHESTRILNFSVKSCLDMPKSQSAKATGIALATMAMGFLTCVTGEGSWKILPELQHL